MPTARMQYTGGSFAEVAAGWFRWILCPVRSIKRPHGLLPQDARVMERIPETVLERVLVPLGGRVMKLSHAVRGLQQGRLHAYIFYLVAGLAALGVIVILGGSP